jgi:hypothetical protein
LGFVLQYFRGSALIELWIQELEMQALNLYLLIDIKRVRL